MNERQLHPPSRKGWLGVVLFVFLLTAWGVRTEPPATPTSTPTATPTPPPTLTPTPTAIPGPFESQPAIPYPSDETVQGLGITRYQVVDNHYVALDDEGDVVAQAITKENGEFDKWQRTLPFKVETNLVVPHPQETNPELLDLQKPDAPIPQFVNAMRMAGIEANPQEVADNLQYQIITGADGKQYVVAVYHLNLDLTNQEEFLKNPIPLLFLTDKNNEPQWQDNNFLIKNSYKNGFFFGSVTQPDMDLSEKILSNYFNSATITYVWSRREPERGKFNMDWMYRQLQETKTMGAINIRLSHILANESYPNWSLKENRQETEKIIRDHIRRTMIYFSSKGVTQFNVANEIWYSDDMANRLGGRDNLILIAFDEANKVRWEIKKK